jgi:hypothetical protein
MATLQSAGVQVQVIDESFYTPSAPGTVPMIFVSSAQDKTNPSGTIAKGTTAANAGKLWLMTSQRDLTDTFGTPKFYTDASGNSQHGNELNEYGLQAAYSALGVSSRIYVVRADLDTAALVPTSSVPEGDPVGGTYWVDTNASRYGIKEWNASTQKFTVKTPVVINDDSGTENFDGMGPSDNVPGTVGTYCMVVTMDNENQLYYKTAGGWVAVIDGFDGGKDVQVSSHYNVPTWTGSNLTGSVWVTTTPQTNGANWIMKKYNSTSQGWDTVSANIYSDQAKANFGLDTTGGKAIPVGTLYIHAVDSTQAKFRLWRRSASGVTTVISNASTVADGDTLTFEIRETLVDGTWSDWKAGSIPGNAGVTVGSQIPAAIFARDMANVSATYSATTNRVTITHTLGGSFEINDSDGAFSEAGFVTGLTNITDVVDDTNATWMGSNWKPLVYEARDNAPYTTPANGTLWTSAIHDEVDIMIHDGTTWVGFTNGTSGTDPLGPIIAAVAPTEQSDGTSLASGDVWISTAMMDKYGKDIYVYDTTIGWVKQDVTDQSSPDGWLFADARWADTGEQSEAASITTLLTSDFLDPDAPDPALYPKGMHLFNTRRSGNNAADPINPRFGDQDTSSYFPDRWVSQHNVAEDGSGVFGRYAQRAQIVAALKSTIDTNSIIRDTDTVVFNLIAAPGYPEAIQNMVGFNTDRGLTAFVIGDTPFRLKPNGTDLSEWGKNTKIALDNNDDGAVTRDEYMALYYPSGYSNDNAGNYIVVPPSHMMLRTIINSDNKSYQWFAPAGTRRGGVDNATSVGYITDEGEFKTAALYQALRDVLQDPDVAINPIATLTGVGIVAYGQRTRARNASSLDRINVARLVCYLRRQLDRLARPYLFEPNDAQTRREIKAAAESLLQELVAQRGLYDYIVVCDETNNTPTRIDRSELYLDIAIEPVKAVEFIYIPLRLKNTGDIKAGL